MSSLNKNLARETQFIARDRVFLISLIVVLCLSSISVWSGLAEIRQQNQTIENLVEAHKEDRQVVLSKQGDWGSAAYYSFHFTYDSPSDFAFAAIGQRDSTPWKHRLRMLALQGQIHEHDAGNPPLALIGRFDFAFFSAFVLPLLMIVLLYDLRSSERVAGRHDLLVVTAGNASSLWITRAFIRSAGVFICAVLPLLLAGLLSGTAPPTLLAGVALISVYVLFWALVCSWIASWQHPASVILAALIGTWILLSMIIPASGRMVIDRVVPIPSGAEILMTQREAVNDAWDLPKEVTMSAFVERHPELSDYSEIDKPFEWKWYYAFQQVGDQKTEALSTAYTTGRVQRDKLASWVAFLAPPALLERSLQGLAETDVSAVIAYEAEVLDFHTALRSYYYPKMFPDEIFDQSALKGLPQFSAKR